MPQPQMPLGVEHFEIVSGTVKRESMPQPQMPLGVEHESVNGDPAAEAHASTSDAVRR